jgi:hypothetical protein
MNPAIFLQSQSSRPSMLGFEASRPSASESSFYTRESPPRGYRAIAQKFVCAVLLDALVMKRVMEEFAGESQVFGDIYARLRG